MTTRCATKLALYCVLSPTRSGRGRGHDVLATAARERFPQEDDLDAGDDAWDVWSERVRARSARAMAEEARRLVALGILDEQGNVLTDELPADMRPSSRTSVET